MGSACAHRPLEYFSSSSSSLSFRSELRVVGEEGGLGEEEDEGGDWGEREPERLSCVLGLFCWAGEREGLSAAACDVEITAGEETEGKGDEGGAPCSLAG